MIPFASRVKKIGSASSIEQNERVYRLKREGKNPVILSYGEAPFQIRPIPFDDKLWDKGAHYSEGLGVPEFRQEISEYCRRHYGFTPNPEKNILVTAGSKLASYYISQIFLDQGDKILLHEPSWVSYQEHAKLAGGTTTFVSHDVSISSVERYIQGGRHKLIYINNPNNPRGYVYSKEELLSLAEITSNMKIILVVDESYSDFCIEEEFFSAGNLINHFDNVVIFNSLSKNFGLSGWRLGYIIAAPEVIAALNKVNQHLMTCAPTNLQLGLVGKLEEIREQVKPQILDLHLKRKAVEALLNKHGVKFLGGSCTFYFFLDFRGSITDSKQFTIELLETELISIIPGVAYGKSTEGFLRLSFGVEPLVRIDESLRVIQRTVLKAIV